MKTILKSVVVGLIFGACVGGFMSYVALHHNPQGEFADTYTGVWTSDLYVLFGIWTAVVAIPLILLLSAIGFFRRQDN